jgi:hypothetical protein
MDDGDCRCQVIGRDRQAFDALVVRFCVTRTRQTVNPQTCTNIEEAMRPGEGGNGRYFVTLLVITSATA